jgi:hypothetical protein
MGLPPEIRRYSRMALGMFELVRTQPIANPADDIRRQVENREENFLDLVRRAVYLNPRSPYCRMLQLAQCEYSDLEQSVRRDGLDRALEALLQAGVYLTQDELKGKAPIVRAGELIPSEGLSYQNPGVAVRIEAQSSGSRSKGTRMQHSVTAQIYWERYNALLADDLGLRDRAFVALLPILPSATGLTMTLRGRQFGWRAERWYAVGGSMLDSGHYRAATTAMVLAGKLAGSRSPFPTYLPGNDFSAVAEYIARRKAAGMESFLGGFVSPAVRVAAAALERGLDISGVIFSVGGEALTPAKRTLLEAAGGRVYPFYSTVEVGPVGYSCRQMKTGNCVHLFEDSVAAICCRRLAPLSDQEVNSLMFTTLAPFAPRVLINAELDDSGIIERAGCDCAFSRVGLTRQIRDIASFGKLTGQGVTLAGTDVVRVLEEALPRRLGGAPGDYQLVEKEGAAQTLLILRVSPRTGSSSTAAIRECFLEELARHHGGSLAARVFRHSDSVEVMIAEPLATVTGKVLPLHLLSVENAERLLHESSVRQGATAD